LIYRNKALAVSRYPDRNRIQPMFAKLASRIETKARLMAAMMARVGVDPVDASRAAGGVAMAAAWRRCLACRSGEQCAAWLAGSSAPAAEPPAFCANASVLAENGVRPASWPTASPLVNAAENGKAPERAA
jgi:Family of unknown function (DUF6455)